MYLKDFTLFYADKISLTWAQELEKPVGKEEHSLFFRTYSFATDVPPTPQSAQTVFDNSMGNILAKVRRSAHICTLMLMFVWD
jgi:hypothetical protein